VTPQLVLLGYLCATTEELSRIDVREQRLPNRLVLPGFTFAALAIVWSWLSTGASVHAPLVSACGYFVGMLVLNRAGGVGMGDVKLAGVLGAAAGGLGPFVALASPAVAFLSGGIAALVALFGAGVGALHRIPFGPFMLFGFWFAVAAA
jgi:leader peptidase (prepilin peptidase) / N-methyltransferase